jgi:hypothetical protein
MAKLSGLMDAHPADRIDHYCGVAMAFMKHLLVHRQIADRRPVRLDDLFAGINSRNEQ